MTHPLIKARAELSAGVTSLLIPPPKPPLLPGAGDCSETLQTKLLQAVQLTTIPGKHPKNNQMVKPEGNAAVNPVTLKSSCVKVLQWGRAECGAGAKRSSAIDIKPCTCLSTQQRLCVSEQQGFLSCLCC